METVNSHIGSFTCASINIRTIRLSVSVKLKKFEEELRSRLQGMLPFYLSPTPDFNNRVFSVTVPGDYVHQASIEALFQEINQLEEDILAAHERTHLLSLADFTT